MNLKKVFFAASPLLLVFVLALPQGAEAASPSLTATETVANVTTGTDLTQASATSSSQANVAEVKATRTLVVANALPGGTVSASSVSFTIGTCVVSLGTVVQDTDCSNNTGAIATTTDTTSALIATRLLTFTGVTDTGHGALTLTASSTNTSAVVFTTTGTESSATNVTYIAGTATNVSSPAYATVTGVIPVAQVWTYTPSNVEIGDLFTAIINGTTITFTATAATVANVTAGLTAAINASAQASAVTAVDGTTVITVTSDTAGTAFTLTKGATNRAAVAQTVTFAPTGVSGNYTMTITLGGVAYSAETGASTAQATAALNAAVSGNASATCTDDGIKVTCVALTPGTGFTYAAAVEGENNNRHGGGGGGGGSSNNTTYSADTSTSAQITALLAQVAALQAQLGGSASVSGFSRDLDVGSTGDDVKNLQKWLNVKGFTVAASGAGSAGSETTTFGGLTQAALAKWQASVGITPAAGYFGPKTRAYLAAHP